VFVTFALMSASSSASSLFRVADFLCEGADNRLPEVLGRDEGGLGFRRFDGGLGDRGGGTGAVFFRHSCSLAASATDPVRCPVVGQQQRGGFGRTVVKGPLQSGKVFEQPGCSG
jgi:hypothetical protein